MSQPISRRSLLQSLGALGLSVTSLGALAPKPEPKTPSKPNRAIRIAHLTDIHIYRDRETPERGIAHTIEHLKRQKDRPAVVLTGGDNLTGTMAQPLEDANVMRQKWEKAFRDAIGFPVMACAGNHDIWGWNKTRSQSTGNEPLWGKNWARDMLQLDKLYYAEVRNGWKFIVLDTVQPDEDAYQGYLDDEQFEWLRGETRTDLPTVVLAHIPVTGISPMLCDARPSAEDKGHIVPYGAVLRDQYRVAKLFADRPNVKLVLGGHIHFVESVVVGHTTYYNSGSISGTWWRTPANDAKRRVEREPNDVPRIWRANPGYAMIDLFRDGTFAIDQVETGFIGDA